MRYQRSYLSFLQQPEWVTTLLAGTACMAVPVVGWTLYLGFLLEALVQQQQQPSLPPPKFDLSRLGTYLGRGLLPGLLQLALWTPLLFLFGLNLTIVLFSGAPGQGPGVGAKLLVSVLSLGILAVALLVSVVLAPLTLHVGLRQQLNPAAALEFMQDFLKRVRTELALAQVFVLVTGLSLSALGLLACGLGVPSALALAVFAQVHLLGQLYALYLQRDGMALTVEAVAPLPIGL